MKIAFFVNDVSTEISEYATTRCALAAARDGHEVWYVGAGDAEYRPDGSIGAHAYRGSFEERDDLDLFLQRVQDPQRCEHIVLDELDAVMLRNDSIQDLHERPWAFNTGILFGQLLADHDVCVVNDPWSLSRGGSKIYLQEFPEEVRPRGLVTRDQDELRAFVKEIGPTVLKPLYGAQGRNVFFVEDEDDANLSQMVEAVLEDGYVVAQERVEGWEDGDIRLFLIDGEPLEKDGTYAAFRRVPEGGDARANISVGGHPDRAEIGPDIVRMVGQMSDRLRRDGMFFVGLDIIGTKVVEINVESPGGFQSTERFTGVDFAPVVVDALAERVRRRTEPAPVEALRPPSPSRDRRTG